MGLFKAKAKLSVSELDELGIKHKNGWVEGNLVWNDGDPYIIGDVADVTEEYFAPEFWINVDVNTIQNNMVQTLKELAKNGVRHDLEPTLNYIGFTKYIKSIDDYVRKQAKKALEI